MMKKIISTFIFICLISVITSTRLAWADQSDMQIPGGQGTGQLSGVTVTNVHYLTNPGDPTQIEAVEFDTDIFQGTVEVKLVSTSTDYFRCVKSSAQHWICSLSDTSVASVDELRVVVKEY
jgi:hypothetical protein